MPRLPIRNIGILAHIDAGKTTLTESLLFETGAIRYPGSVDDGSTMTDWQRAEQERGITIASAAITCSWRDADITIVDTPGHVDFTIEVERALRVLDSAVLVVSGPDGVQAQTETVWNQAEHRGVPTIAWINKLDRPGFDDGSVLAELRDRLGMVPLQLQIPRITATGVELIDVLGGRLLAWDLNGLVRRQRATQEVRALDPEAEIDAEIAYERIIDAIASFDDELAERFLAAPDERPPLSLLHRALRRAIAARACTPVLYGVARFGVGVTALADAVVDFLPAPDEVAPPRMFSTIDGSELAPPAPPHTASFVFKTEARMRGRRLAFVRVFTGRIDAGDVLQRGSGDDPLVVRGLVRIMGGDTEPIEVLEAGMIGGIEALADEGLPRTGETLSRGAIDRTFEPIEPPPPVLAIAVEAPDDATDAAIERHARALCDDDPSLTYAHDPDSGRTLLSGMGELHLALAVERIEEAIGARLRASPPTIRRRKLIMEEGQGTFTAGDALGGRGSVTIVLRAMPLAERIGDRVRLACAPPRRPDWRAALIAGVRSATGADGFTSDSVVGVQIVVDEIRTQGSDLAPVIFRDAAFGATRDALDRAGCLAAEPWVALTIVAPDEAVGKVVGDLARRRARIRGSEGRGIFQSLSVDAPLEAMLGYASDLRSLTAGRGRFSMEPRGYEPV